MTENWKGITGFESAYQVSDHGRVRSLPRVITRKDGVKKTVPGKIITPNIQKDGRRAVRLWKNNTCTTVRVSTLVASAFISPKPPGLECCHNDGDNSNNHASNLRWGTRRENMMDKRGHGTDHQVNKSRCPRGHLHADWNNVPFFAKQGRRSCLACSRARSYVQVNPYLKPHLQKISDSYYEKLGGQLE